MLKIRFKQIILISFISMIIFCCENPFLLDKEKGNSGEMMTYIEDYFIPSGIWNDDTLKISFRGKLADSSCYHLSEIELESSNNEAVVTVWSEKIPSVECEPIPVSFEVKNFVIPPPYSSTFNVQIKQHDTSILSKDVSIVAFDPSIPKITFESFRDGYYQGGTEDIFLMDEDGNNIVNISKYGDGGFRPKFTSDGEYIIYITYEDESWSLNMMDLKGRNQTNLLRSSSYFDAEYAISSDNLKIAYSSKSKINILNLEDSTIVTVQSTGSRMWPDFSPDGNTIVYNNGQIYVANVNGIGEIALTNNPHRTIRPQFSPNSEKIVYLFGPDQGTVREIYIMDSDGKNQKKLTETDIQELRAWFFPKGDHILFKAWDYDNYGLYIIDIDGLGYMRLTDSTYSARNPSISPDGEKIVFDYIDETWTSGGIYQINADGSGLRSLTNNPSDRHPQIQP